MKLSELVAKMGYDAEILILEENEGDISTFPAEFEGWKDGKFIITMNKEKKPVHSDNLDTWKLDKI